MKDKLLETKNLMSKKYFQVKVREFISWRIILTVARGVSWPGKFYCKDAEAASILKAISLKVMTENVLPQWQYLNMSIGYYHHQAQRGTG